MWIKIFIIIVGLHVYFCAILKAFTVPARRQIVRHVVKVTNYADNDENILPIFSKAVLRALRTETSLHKITRKTKSSEKI